MSQVFLSRPNVILKKNSPQFTKMIGFGKKVVEVSKDKGAFVALHGEASLISALGQCVAACHAISKDEINRRQRFSSEKYVERILAGAPNCRTLTPEPVLHGSE